MSIDAPSDSTGNAPDQMGIRRMGRYLLPLLFLGLAVHLIPPQIASLEHSVQVLRTLALWAVGLAVMAQAVSYAGSGYLLQATVALAQGSVSILKSLMITLASASIGLVAGAATFRWLMKEGVNADSAGLAGTWPAMFNNGVLPMAACLSQLCTTPR